MIIVPSAELISRTVETEAAYTLSRMRVLQRLPGNPIGVGYRKAGKNGWALMARHLPVPSFNAIVGLRAGDEGGIADVLQWYRDNDAKPQVEIVPGLEGAALMHELARLGFQHSGFHASVIMCPQDAAAVPPALDVQRVTDRRMLEDFLTAYIAGWRIPDGDGFRRNVRPWIDQEGWSLFLGRVDGKPVAEGVLYVRDRFAYLADAATDPQYRGRGLQTALLAHRLRHAAEQGVTYVCSGASFLSSSHRNMVRAGMTLQFVRAIWTEI